MQAIRSCLKTIFDKLKAIVSPDAAASSRALPTQPVAAAPLSVGADNDLVNDTRWRSLVEECVALVAELDRYLPDFDPPRQEVAEHVCNRLVEILARNHVSLISEDAPFDRNLHEPDKPAAGLQTGAAQAHILSPGFKISRRILRRARVEIVQEIPFAGE